MLYAITKLFYPQKFSHYNNGIHFSDATSAHDTIGTLFIRMSDISSPSNDNSGYLPTFGPCYMNIYGSPREFSVLPDKYDHINKGLFEGVAYRGRIMVEVNLFSQTLPSQQIEDIKRYDIRQLQPFLTQCTYRLFGVFYSATMIHPHHSNVEFEVSIGNYGNKLEVNTPRQLSTTPISTPVFDGNNYYFLPWEKYKPCILIDSSWENVTSRIEAQNILLYITKDLGKKLHHIKNELFICTNEDKDMIMANFIDGLKEIINTIRYICCHVSLKRLWVAYNLIIVSKYV
jgi:dysferlin